MSLSHFFGKFGHFVSVGFVAIFGKDAATKFAKAAVDLLKTDTGKIALDAVSEVAALSATNGWTNEQKRAEAFSRIAATAKAAGKDLSTHTVNQLIELSVGVINKDFGTAQPQ